MGHHLIRDVVRFIEEGQAIRAHLVLIAQRSLPLLLCLTAAVFFCNQCYQLKAFPKCPLEPPERILARADVSRSSSDSRNSIQLVDEPYLKPVLTAFKISRYRVRSPGDACKTPCAHSFHRLRYCRGRTRSRRAPPKQHLVISIVSTVLSLRSISDVQPCLLFFLTSLLNNTLRSEKRNSQFHFRYDPSKQNCKSSQKLIATRR